VGNKDKGRRIRIRKTLKRKGRNQSETRRQTFRVRAS
jgi:hypothetical protein